MPSVLGIGGDIARNQLENPMRTINNGMLPYMGIADSIKAERAMQSEAEHDRLVEAYLEATEPKALAYAGGRMIYDRPPVEVTVHTHRAARFRWAKVSFFYSV